MFTGLVEELGSDRAHRGAPGRAALLDRAPRACSRTPRVGDSVAVDGCCLTAVARRRRPLRGRRRARDAARAPRSATGATGDARSTSSARCALDQRLGGHLVQGHVDGVGDGARASRPKATAAASRIALPAALARFVAEKGSIAVDGVSLTVARASRRRALRDRATFRTRSRVTVAGALRARAARQPRGRSDRALRRAPARGRPGSGGPRHERARRHAAPRRTRRRRRRRAPRRAPRPRARGRRSLTVEEAVRRIRAGRMIDRGRRRRPRERGRRRVRRREGDARDGELRGQARPRHPVRADGARGSPTGSGCKLMVTRQHRASSARRSPSRWTRAAAPPPAPRRSTAPRTLRALADPAHARRRTSCGPGHVFPLRAVPGGVLRRAGHTEAVPDLCRLAGLRPVGRAVRDPHRRRPHDAAARADAVRARSTGSASSPSAT